MEMEMEMEKMAPLADTMSLPKDIIFEILSRLPAKKLLQLKWACKYWFNLITRDPDFIKLHLHYSTTHNNKEIFSLSLLGATDGFSDDRDKIFQRYLNYNSTTTGGEGGGGVVDVSNEVIIISDPPLEYPLPSRPIIMGSCNGLIFLYRTSDLTIYNLCIWNLCTKEYRVLPNPLSNIEGVPFIRYGKGKYNYGFGYDHTNDDYKVIRTAEYSVNKDGLQDDLHTDVQVYTLGTNSWRRIEANSYGLRPFLRTPGVFVNGALYWLAELDTVIISFDLGTEKFRHVSRIPDFSCYESYVSSCSVNIGAFEGSLSLVLSVHRLPSRMSTDIYLKPSDFYSEIWVMNDYAVNNNNNDDDESLLLWTKLSTIRKLRGIKPLRCTRNDEILIMSCRRDLVLFDRKTGNFKTLCSNFCCHNFHQVYTDSLVSLNSGTYTGQEQRREEQPQHEQPQQEQVQPQQEEDAMMAWRKTPAYLKFENFIIRE